MIAHAEETLAKTPEMLPVLKEAGVVDSGGQGLLEVYHGAYDGFLGKEIDYTQFDKAKGPAVTKIDAQTEADIKFWVIVQIYYSSEPADVRGDRA